MKAIYFASFYFRGFNSIREIRENKNLAKISTYTIYSMFILNTAHLIVYKKPFKVHSY